MENKQVDYIIVGQGLAGTLLGYFLEKNGQKIHLIDQAHRAASSKVAAGIINPITGRNFVKSWRFEDVFPFAKKTYQEIGDLFNQTFFYSQNIVRELFNDREENEWMVRSSYPDYEDYFEEDVDWKSFDGKVNKKIFTIELKHAGRLDIPKLIHFFSEYWLKKNQIEKKKFEYDKILFLNGGVQYENIKASKIIFCEGFQAKHNPYFSNLNYQEAKGEILKARIPHADFQKILKHRLYIVPQGNDIYWIGATNEWDHLDENPTSKNFEFLKNKLEKILKIPFEILSHEAAVRPTNKDRRPLLGIHPEKKQLAIFNGMGSKGASLAPFWANAMTQHLLKNVPLDKEVDIDRVYRKIQK